MNGEPRPDLDGALDLRPRGVPRSRTRCRSSGTGSTADRATTSCLMAFIRVPTLEVTPNRQRYTFLRRLDAGALVRYSSGSFRSDLTIDEDGFVLDYPQLGRRIGPRLSAGVCAAQRGQSSSPRSWASARSSGSRRGVGRVGRSHDGVRIQGERALVDERRELGDRPELDHRADGERRSPTSPWPGTTAPVDELDQPLDRRRPFHRIAVAEVRRRAVLDEIAGEQHVGVRHEDHDVVVGVGATEIAELDPAAAGVEVERSSASPSNVRSGGSRTTSASSSASAGIASATFAIWAAPVSADHPRAAGMAPDRRRPEPVVAERVVVVAVGVRRRPGRAAA